MKDRKLTWLVGLLTVLVIGCQQKPLSPQERVTVASRRAPTVAMRTRSEPVETSLPDPAPSPSAVVPMVGESLVLGRDEVAARARKELGLGIVVEPVAENFILVGNRSTTDGSRRFVEMVLGALMNGRFEKGLSKPIAVYLFPDAGSYEGYCRKMWGAGCISRFGFFEPSSYELVMNIGLGIGTLSHEMVHPIMSEDFPQAPTWLSEGIASLFEAPVMPRTGEIHGAKNWRHPRLIAGLSSPLERRTTTLTALFALSNGAFRDGAEDLHYAMARYFCQWMDQNGKLWDFYHQYRDNVLVDPTGESAFREVTSTSLQSAQEPWARWVKGL